jgi:hypothetical protein
MSRRPARFTQRDLAKAIRAIVAAGMVIASIKVDKSGATIVTVGDQDKTESADRNEWDD